jgi:uncharacterized protein YjiS (DUF1127 family)
LPDPEINSLALRGGMPQKMGVTASIGTSMALGAVHQIHRAVARPLRENRSWVAAIDKWWRRSREREILMTMSDRELKDIGITRYDAQYEARKPFWRA